jgi:peptidoglycan/LPS O-acetylase OafA/YrhL
MLLINLILLLGVRADIPAVLGVLAVSLGLGALSWVWVERPFLRLKRGSLRAAMAVRRPVDRSQETGEPIHSLN